MTKNQSLQVQSYSTDPKASCNMTFPHLSCKNSQIQFSIPNREVWSPEIYAGPNGTYCKISANDSATMFEGDDGFETCEVLELPECSRKHGSHSKTFAGYLLLRKHPTLVGI